MKIRYACGLAILAVALVACGQAANGPEPVRVEGAWPALVSRELFDESADRCEAKYLNASKVEGFILGKIRERILTEETITELVTLVAEEIDTMAGEIDGRLKVIEAELGGVETRLENSIKPWRPSISP